MKFAYADPPYPGCASLYLKENPHASEVNHPLLIRHLVEEFPDGWALSSNAPNVRYIQNLMEEIVPGGNDAVRLCPWVKTFAIYKANVTVAYAWEPIFLYGGRKRTRKQPTIKDWVAAPVTIKKGVPGAKPPQFWHFIFELLNLEPDDEFHDLFPGSGGGAVAWREWTTYKQSLFLPANVK